MSDLDSVNWPALERMFACRDYGRGFWRYVSDDVFVRSYGGPLPHDSNARGLWSRRGFMVEDDAVSGEFTAEEST